VRQSIRGYSDALIALSTSVGSGGRTSLSSLAFELASLGAVFGGSEDLRRALSDPDVPVPARRGVLRDLFSGRVSDPAMRALSFIVDADRAGEFVADVGWMAERIDAATRDMEPVGDVVLGLKGAEERVDGYATAILETVDGERALSNIEDELFRFSRVVSGSDELRGALSNRDYPAPARRGLVRDLLQGKASSESVSLATYLTKVGRPRDYEDLLGGVIDRVASECNRRLADVRSALPLDEEQERNLAWALSRMLGRDVEIRVTVDPSVVAGFVATVGDTVVDGSARHQLELLKERLVLPEASFPTGQITTEERH
jgi:F-type H+-transporting ATPase subunit delta